MDAGGAENVGGVGDAAIPPVVNGGAWPTGAGGLPQHLDECSLDRLIETKIARFLSQLGDYPLDNLHALFMGKFEKSFLTQIMRHTGGNQMQASRLLGMNRNTLRKRLRAYNIG